MKTCFARLVFVAISGFLLTACGPAGDSGAAANAPGATLAPITPGTPEAPREIKIEVGDSMQFSRTRIEALAGETVRVLLVNTGVAPKEAMGHNWVLLRAGVDVNAYANAAVAAKAADYLPVERSGDVLAHTRLIGGGGRDAVVFTVPETAGEYPYLCTFPAHCQLGMKGVLLVK